MLKRNGKLKYFIENLHCEGIFWISCVASRRNLGISIFNWNALHKLQQNAEGVYSCLICYQLVKKYRTFLFLLFLWKFFGASIAVECYHFYSECEYVLYVLHGYRVNHLDFQDT